MVLTYLHLLDPESFPLKITRPRSAPLRRQAHFVAPLLLTAILDQPFFYGGDPILAVQWIFNTAVRWIIQLINI